MDISYSIPDVAFLGGGPFTPVNTETAAFFARLATQPTKGRAQLYDAMITALKAGGVWSTFDVFYILAAFDSATARTNLVSSSFTASAATSPTFTKDQGFASNGSTSYLDTTYDPSTLATNYALNAAHIAVWDLTNRGVTAAARVCGRFNGSSEIMIAPNFTGPQTFIRVNDGLALAAVTTSNGFFLGSRTGSNALAEYQNTTSLGTNAGGAGASVPAGNIFICAENNAGTPIGLSTDVISMFSIGGALTPTQAAAYYNAVHTYMQSVAGVA